MREPRSWILAVVGICLAAILGLAACGKGEKAPAPTLPGPTGPEPTAPKGDAPPPQVPEVPDDPSGGGVRDLPEMGSAAPEDGVPKGPTSVTIFYATDRARFTPSLGWYASRLTFAGVVFLLGWLVLRILRKVVRTEYQRGVTLLRVGHVLTVLLLAALGVYAGLRMQQTDARLSVQYGGERLRFPAGGGLPLEFGTLQVNIPPDHREGHIERPSPWRGDFFEDPEKHMMVFSIRPVEEAAFFRDVAEVVDGSTNQDAFVFVHGYNVPFEDAALRTAQIARDLRYDGAPICYSWPSQGVVTEYKVDEANVAWTAAHLKSFLLALRERSGAKKIHLIAHSMGNRALTEALLRIGRSHAATDPVFNQIVLAAPDIDAETFREDIAPGILGTGRNVTLYASSRDSALLASRLLHGSPRAGETGENLVVLPGMDTIDVSSVSGGHSYIGNNGKVLSDLGTILNTEAAVDHRPGLAARAFQGLRYWLIERLAE